MASRRRGSPRGRSSLCCLAVSGVSEYDRSREHARSRNFYTWKRGTHVEIFCVSVDKSLFGIVSATILT